MVGFARSSMSCCRFATLAILGGAHKVLLLVLEPLMDASVQQTYNWILIVGIVASAGWLVVALLHESWLTSLVVGYDNATAPTADSQQTNSGLPALSAPLRGKLNPRQHWPGQQVPRISYRKRSVALPLNFVRTICASSGFPPSLRDWPLLRRDGYWDSFAHSGLYLGWEGGPSLLDTTMWRRCCPDRTFSRCHGANTSAVSTTATSTREPTSYWGWTPRTARPDIEPRHAGVQAGGRQLLDRAAVQCVCAVGHRAKPRENRRNSSADHGRASVPL